MKKFRIEPHKSYDKFFHILGPGENDAFMRIDNDDVDHDDVKRVSEKIVDILNDNWNAEKYNDQDQEFKKWFKNKFHEISENILNGETAEDIDIHHSSKIGTVITFDVDANDAGKHRGGKAVINGAKVRVTLPEVIEGAGIEEDMEEAIKGKLKL